MGRVADLLQAKGPLSQRVILSLVKGKTETKREALHHLIADGYVTEKTPHQLVKPFEIEVDPA